VIAWIVIGTVWMSSVRRLRRYNNLSSPAAAAASRVGRHGCGSDRGSRRWRFQERPDSALNQLI